jgi:hypothetical protein
MRKPLGEWSPERRRWEDNERLLNTFLRNVTPCNLVEVADILVGDLLLPPSTINTEATGFYKNWLSFFTSICGITTQMVVFFIVTAQKVTAFTAS